MDKHAEVKEMPLTWLKSDIPTLALDSKDTAFFDELVSQDISECHPMMKLLSGKSSWDKSADENDGY